MKLKEGEKLEKYKDLTSELKKLWSMKEIVIPIVVRILGIISKNKGQNLDEMDIRERIKTIKIKALPNLA